MNQEQARTALRAFGETYEYDASYLEFLLDHSPGAFEAFQPVQPMSSYRDALPLDAHFVARYATMRAEDCGACTQLNLRMAVEAGVDRELLAAALRGPDALAEPLASVYRHAHAVAAHEDVDAENAARIREAYGDAAFAELALVIAACRVYPALKRALLRDHSCPIPNLDF